MSEQKQWMAIAPGIPLTGPYASDIEAWRAVRGHDGLPVPGARVWPVSDNDLLLIRRGGKEKRHGL